MLASEIALASCVLNQVSVGNETTPELTILQLFVRNNEKLKTLQPVFSRRDITTTESPDVASPPERPHRSVHPELLQPHRQPNLNPNRE